MHYQSGTMRDLHFDNSPSRNSHHHLENDFHQTQRSKYQKSEISYSVNQKSKVHYEYEGDRTDRFAHKTSHDNNKEIIKSIPFKVKSIEHEDRVGYLQIQMNIVHQKNLNTFVMHITDDKDSMFLWTCYLRESEFTQLKKDQSLHLDFHGLPGMINQLLEVCVDLENDPKIRENKDYLFALFEMKKEQANFKILQKNIYKETNHFQLIFKRANDEQSKKYLSKKFDDEKMENTKLNRQIADLHDKLNRRIEEVQTLSINFEQMEKQKNQRIFELQRSEKDKIKREVLKIQEEKMREQKEEKQKNDRKFQEKNDLIKQLTQKCEEMRQKQAENHKKIIDLEQSQKSLKLKNTTLEKDLQGLQQMNILLKNSQASMNKQFHELKNQNTRLTCTIQNLQQRMKERDARLAETHEQRSTNSSQIINLQEQLRQQKKKMQKIEQKNDNLQQQLSKTKKKYEELSSKHNKKKQKLTEFVTIIKKQEEKVNDGQDHIKKLISDLTYEKKEKQEFQRQVRKKNEKINQLKEKVQKLEEENDDKKKLLSKAHKDLNEKKFQHRISNYNSTSSSFVKDYSLTLPSANSSSRIKFTDPSSINNENQKSDIIVPKINKYRGSENDRNRQNSKSPIVNRLSQQQDPQETQKIKPRAIKFAK